MKLYLIPVNKLIKQNDLKEVRNPVYFEPDYTPTKEGLFSTEIFGTTIKERKRTFAFIDLHGKFLQPSVYKMLKRMDQRLIHIASGVGDYGIDSNGYLVTMEEGKGKTGLQWLYDNWDKIKWKRNESGIREEKIELLEANKRDTLFCDKWPVIPPFIRDVNLQQLGSGKVVVNKINEPYVKLLRYAKMIQSESEFDFTLNNARFQIQQTLEELYDMLGDILSGKTGLIRNNLLSKSVINSTISVITQPRMKVQRVDEEMISVTKVGVPLASLAIQFYPFVIYELRRFFANEFELTGNRYPVRQKIGDSEVKYYKLDEPMMYFTEEYFKKRVDLFYSTPHTRFDTVKIPVINPESGERLFVKMNFRGKYPYEGEASIANRLATWMDILYLCVHRAIQGKHVVITRYPVLDTFGTFIATPHILTTLETETMIFNDETYPYYPKVDLNMSPMKASVYFLDTITTSDANLKGLDGDFDGDTVVAKGIWSQQANNQAREIMYSKSNLFSIDGKNRRVLTNEAIQTLFNLTKA